LSRPLLSSPRFPLVPAQLGAVPKLPPPDPARSARPGARGGERHRGEQTQAGDAQIGARQEEVFPSGPRVGGQHDELLPAEAVGVVPVVDGEAHRGPRGDRLPAVVDDAPQLAERRRGRGAQPDHQVLVLVQRDWGGPVGPAAGPRAAPARRRVVVEVGREDGAVELRGVCRPRDRRVIDRERPGRTPLLRRAGEQQRRGERVVEVAPGHQAAGRDDWPLPARQARVARGRVPPRLAPLRGAPHAEPAADVVDRAVRRGGPAAAHLVVVAGADVALVVLEEVGELVVDVDLGGGDLEFDEDGGGGDKREEGGGRVGGG